MHYYFVTGESSGDLYAAKLIQALRDRAPQAQFSGWGGEQMLRQGVDLVQHIKGKTYSGFIQVLLNLRKIQQDFKIIENDLAKKRPGAVILIDYAGFNLRVAKIAKKLSIKVFWFVAPQIWVWRKYRIKALRRYVDELFVILPFEPDFYQAHAVPCHYYGHPLLDIINDYQLHNKNKLENKNKIALLPGSRPQEIQKLLPIMLQVAKQFMQEQFIVVATENVDKKLYQEALSYPNVQLIFDKTYTVLAEAKAALVASGTATLEVALFRVPQVVCYRLDGLLYYLIKFFVRLPYYSLVNIIYGKKIVSELLQSQCTREHLSVALNELLQPKIQKDIFSKYDQLLKKLGTPGCFNKIARKMVEISAKEGQRT